MVEEVIGYFKKKRLHLQETLLFKEKQSKEVKLSLKESPLSFRPKSLILKLSLKLQLRRINKESILLREKIGLYEKAILDLKGNLDCAIQLIEEEIEKLFTVSCVNLRGFGIIDVGFKVCSPYEFYYLYRLKEQLVHCQGGKL